MSEHPSADSVAEYYAWKADEYDAKYSRGPVTHIHTGHFTKHWLQNPSRPHIRNADYLRRLMYEGQERTIELLFGKTRALSEDLHVLDCGAGHGGTSIWLAERVGCQVTSLVLSDVQRNRINARAQQTNLGDKIRGVVGDARESMPAGRFDVVFGIDSFCQIGSLASTFRLARASQPAGGQLLISDSFLTHAATPEDRTRFNEYWVSDISTVDGVLAALDSSGYRLDEFSNTTSLQNAFWELSIQYSEITKSSSNNQDARASQSSAFHRFLLDAYRSGRMQYIQLAATAV